MPGTLTPACSFCGLRFASRPLLELHIREDHLQRDHHPERDRGDAARARASQPRADAPAPTHGQSSRSPPATKEVVTMTATPRRRRLRRMGDDHRARSDPHDPARQCGVAPGIRSHVPPGRRGAAPIAGRDARRPA